MLKQSIIYLVLSVLVVIFSKYIHLFIVYIDMFYAYINIKLRPFFEWSGMSYTLIRTFLLIIIPVIIALIPALVYRLIKGANMPNFIALTWCLWLVIVLSNILIH